MLKFILLILIFLTFSNLVSCSNNESYKNQNIPQSETVEGFVINNSPIDSPEMLYDLQELKTFFSGSIFEVDCGKVLYLDDINLKFPLEYLRKTSHKESGYIVYPVIEGGQYIVFLVSELDDLTEEKKMIYYTSWYIKDLQDHSVLDEITIGMTYDDLKELLPCTQMNSVMSSSIESYSLLSDGEILKCTYNKTNMGEYHILTKSVLSKDDPSYPYNGILESDLIENTWNNHTSSNQITE